jgi:NAD-dependent dihydropyrimidine dehydrogenase PreA subunit
VLLDHDHCIGCRYCSWVCPYGAPQYNPSTRVMEKCTFCSHRLAEDLEPACVTACPVDALGFAHRGEPDTARHPGFPDVGLRPGLHLTAKRRYSAPPEMTPLPLSELEGLPATPSASVELAGEWPLLVFTLIASLLVAWFTAWAVGSRPPVPCTWVARCGPGGRCSTSVTPGSAARSPPSPPLWVWRWCLPLSVRCPNQFNGRRWSWASPPSFRSTWSTTCPVNRNPRSPTAP